ncbi:NAD-glutamate dehydrogenase [Motiliproteus sediminis]|uniref:NAD-glutamate dehydrogenase n=1 Tax=Motiliproteus sediminis TaxID=1468178 RepID=UPI001AEFD661|nr:NAD-glutamate dehydrogenase [Motiliproteus sediminis]
MHGQETTRQSSIDRLLQRLCNGFGITEDDPLCRFALYLCRSVSAQELAERSLDDLYGSTVEAWRLFEQYRGGDPRIRVFNPHFDQHGWQSAHTVIMVLSADMPFLIDSIRMEINRREMTIHSIANGIMAVRRDDQGMLLDMEPAGDKPSPHIESLIVLEINRRTDLNELAALEQSLRDVLAEVALVTDDFAPMVEATRSLRQRIAAGKQGIDPFARGEAVAFLDWLLDNHFTFLGYRAYEPSHGQEAGVTPVRGSGLGLLRRRSGRTPTLGQALDESEQRGLSELICFAKSPKRARVHRPAYADFIAVREYGDDGDLVREHRFVGLYTSAVYFQSSRQIPVIRHKVRQVIERAGLHPGSHDHKALWQILEVHPRDDLFQSSEDELYHTVVAILHIHERRQVRSFFRRDPLGRYYSVLVFTPRDIFNTDLRKRIQQVLCEELDASEVEFNTFISESILARTQFILHLDPKARINEPDIEPIRQRIVQVTRSWHEQFAQLLIEAMGEEAGVSALQRLEGGIPVAYREDFSPRSAVADMQTLLALTEQHPLALSFYRPLDQGDQQLNFKVFHCGSPLPLSDIIPIMENLGLRVIDEHPYQIQQAGVSVWIHDFRMEPHEQVVVELELLRQDFEEAFQCIWQGLADSDSFNRLVLGAQLGWREVVLLRAMAAYMKQTGFAFSEAAIAAALRQQQSITRRLVRLFHARFEPESASQEAADKLVAALEKAIDGVESLTQDRILRRYLQQLCAIERTNYYQRDADRNFKRCLAFKFSPRSIAELPRPVPYSEIFVFSPQTEGVHLRNGPVARGGLRWSDRNEDYRTEVLGLVKAQQVKNAVIVPVGAKGGFVCKRSLDGLTPSQRQHEGIASYREFVGGLLDLADNLVAGEVVPPADVVRHDGDDPYLVVAADKGTATFSDIANELAQQYGFWLGDAFASGGSEGYDHKAMGITARGAWVSVQRHFRERGVDIQRTPFTVIGIGDMGGDVFGNGMLLSPCIQLVAAFNHRHLFVDPEPDIAAAFAERQRLFKAVAGWDEYDRGLISSGGGVFDRTAKSIPISAEMQRRFGLQAKQMAPTELIHALLQAPVDLLWNGGIGTYVKSGAETHVDVGDKANDALRVDASQLRCKVVGEGGNLGMTQRARTEFSLAGGACNSDFVDNAGGVDCSDHEVNIKIMLDALVERGDLTVKQRNQRLRAMTDEIAELVLESNYRQTQAISIADQQCRQRMIEYRHLISQMEQRGLLERELEAIPADDELEVRQQQGQSLTRNELAVLVAYAKAELKEALATAAVSDDPLMNDALAAAFPAGLARDYPHALTSHRLREQLIASQLANQLVNHMGVTFVSRMRGSAGASLIGAAQAYMVARTIYRMPHWWAEIEALDNLIDAEVQLRMMSELQRLVRRAGRWLLRSRGEPLDTPAELERFAAPMRELAENLGEWLQGGLAQKWRDRFYFFNQAGVPDPLARQLASVDGLYVGLAIIEVAKETGAELSDVVEVYCMIGEQLDVFWFSRQVDGLRVTSSWQAKARESYRDEIDVHVRSLATTIIGCAREQGVAGCFRQWSECNRLPVERWLAMLADLKQQEEPDYAIFTVATRELAELAERCELPCSAS